MENWKELVSKERATLENTLKMYNNTLKGIKNKNAHSTCIITGMQQVEENISKLKSIKTKEAAEEYFKQRNMPLGLFTMLLKNRFVLEIEGRESDIPYWSVMKVSFDNKTVAITFRESTYFFADEYFQNCGEIKNETINIFYLDPAGVKVAVTKLLGAELVDIVYGNLCYETSEPVTTTVYFDFNSRNTRKI